MSQKKEPLPFTSPLPPDAPSADDIVDMTAEDWEEVAKSERVQKYLRQFEEYDKEITRSKWRRWWRDNWIALIGSTAAVIGMIYTILAYYR